MDVVIKTDPIFDDAAHTVTYNISVVPGQQYRIKDVTAQNLDPAALADFNKVFRLTKGELYNPEYVKGFLKNNNSVKSLEPYIASYKAYADPDSHTVDLVLHLRPPPLLIVPPCCTLLTPDRRPEFSYQVPSSL